MKKKNGFTLIELLAIIVILAIIAVITVPIILNIIENSRRGAATDSAYGYKDAVNKWYVSKLQEDSGYTLNGNYNVSDGKLNNIEIPLLGDKPTGGNLHYTNNVLDGGCLTIGDYKVTFDSKGSVSSTEKGSCDSSNIVLSCSGDEYLYEEYNYTVTGQEACRSYIENVWGCDGNEECLQAVSDYCAGNLEFTIADDINDGSINYSDVESFVSRELVDSLCVHPYGYSIAQNGYDPNDSTTLSTSKPVDRVYLRYSLVRGVVVDGTVPEVCINVDTYGEELCLKNNNIVASKTKTLEYFGYDANTWIQDESNQSVWYSDSNHTKKCRFMDAYTTYCNTSDMKIEAYVGGNVNIAFYSDDPRGWCFVNNDGSAKCPR